jgi:hypothetical protein
MAIKYYCDTCGKEIPPASPSLALAIATIEIIEPATWKQTSQMLCKECTPKVKEWISKQQKDNGVVAINKDFKLNIAK